MNNSAGVGRSHPCLIYGTSGNNFRFPFVGGREGEENGYEGDESRVVGVCVETFFRFGWGVSMSAERETNVIINREVRWGGSSSWTCCWIIFDGGLSL